VTKGLQRDSYDVVAFVLDRLWLGVVRKEGWRMGMSSRGSEIDNRSIQHSRWEIFDQNTLGALVSLLDRDHDSKEAQLKESSSPETVGELVERFLTHLTSYVATLTSTNVFQPLINSRMSQCRLLFNLVKTLGPSKSLRRQRLTLHALRLCPSLFSNLWRNAAPAFDASPTIGWLSSVGFATKAIMIPITIPVTTKYIDSNLENRNVLTNVAGNLLALCIPTPLTRLWFTKTLQHPNALVCFSVLSLLLAGLKKAVDLSHQIQKAIKSYEDNLRLTTSSRTDSDSLHNSTGSNLWSSLLLAFHQNLQAILPDPQVIVAALRTGPGKVQEPTAAAPASPLIDTQDAVGDCVGNSEAEADSDIMSFHLLSLLVLYRQLLPKVMYNLTFDYSKLVPTFLSVTLATNSDSSASKRVKGAVTYLCQSRVLRLVGRSASTIQMSATLLSFLLSLSSTPVKGYHQVVPDVIHVPLSIKEAAYKALEALAKYNVPHLEDQYEAEELSIWSVCLTELRRSSEDISPLTVFLEDCIRSCLRNPLKYAQMSAEYLQSDGKLRGPPMPLLLATLLSNTTAVVKASLNDPTSLARVRLITLVIKFLNVHFLSTLSTPHKLRPIHLIHFISSRFCITISSLNENQETGATTYPSYLGPCVLRTLRTISQSCEGDEPSYPPRVPWSSLYSQSCFFHQCCALDFMDQLNCRSSKGGVALQGLSFMEHHGSHEEFKYQNSGAAGKHRRSFIRFMTRALELELCNFDHRSETLTYSKLLEQEKLLDFYPAFKFINIFRIKAVLVATINSLDGDPCLIESFLKDERVWLIAQLSLARSENAILFGNSKVIITCFCLRT